MKKTLQDQYLLIKEGKGHKGVFLTEAKRQFPHIIRNSATFDEAVASLKTKHIISENIISVMPTIMDRPKKEAYETAFEAFLAEAKKKKDEDEKVKAEEKKVSKPVEEDLAHNFNSSDEKNPDNMIFGQIMMGYYAEMKDPKNSEKTMQELKDIVFKNLTKDPIYYTKNAQFGIKDLGYTDEVPALGTPKEAKGKYKSSGYGDLNEGVMYSDSDGDRDADMESTIQANEYYDKGLEAYNKGDKLKAEKYYQAALRAGSWLGWTENDLPPYDSLNEGMFSSKPLGDVEAAKRGAIRAFRSWFRNHANRVGLGGYDMEDPKQFSDDEIIRKAKGFGSNKNNKHEQIYDLWQQSKHLFESIEESKLRKVIREIISEELGEAMYQGVSVNPSKTGGGRRNIPSDVILTNDVIKTFDFSNPGPNTPAYDESIRIPHIKLTTSKETGKTSLLISDFLDIALKGITKGRTTRETELAKNVLQKRQGDITDKDWSMIRPLIKKYTEPKPIPYPIGGGKTALYHEVIFPNTPESLGDKFETGFSLDKVDNGLKINLPKTKKSTNTMESLRESVEKEIAEINKMAEYENLQSKLDKLEEAIEKRRSQLERLDEDEDMKALTDSKKVKSLHKDIKILESAKKKVEKMMSKFKGKKPEDKEVIDETENDPDVNQDYFDQSVTDLRQGKSIDSISSEDSNLALTQQEDLKDYLKSL